MKRQIGAIGEALAVQYLRDAEYDILAQNWHCPYGEVDIVACYDQTIWVFCEVKTRRGTTTQQALTAITDRKRQRLIATAHAYLSAHMLEQVSWRIDAIAVVLHHNQPPSIEHVEDALDW
ncbi:MAG: YraN family protein [Anaerolineae bacterium]